MASSTEGLPVLGIWRPLVGDETTLRTDKFSMYGDGGWQYPSVSCSIAGEHWSYWTYAHPYRIVSADWKPAPAQKRVVNPIPLP